MKKQKKSKNSSNLFMMIAAMPIGAAFGFSFAATMDYAASASFSIGKTLYSLSALILAQIAALYLQILIHESGHWIAGLLSGYTFSSFRIGNFMWIKENGTIKLRKLSLAGTGGQCLMNPPEPIDGKIPFVFYNLGGVLMNLLTIPVFAVLLAFFNPSLLPSAFFLMMIAAGFSYAMMNGIPMKLQTVNNDGSNAKELSQSPEALRSFWLQLKISEQTAQGVRLKDMPSEWFSLPKEEDRKNSMTSVIAVFCANRLIDEHAFDRAAALIDQLLSETSGLIGLYRNLLICDRLYCELIGKRNGEAIAKLYNKEQRKAMKQMRTLPSVLRTEYAYALLYQNEPEKAAQIKNQFEQRAKTYPYPSDIESERELIALADKTKLHLENHEGKEDQIF